MSLSNNWFDRLIRLYREQHRQQRVNLRRRLQIESLEARTMLAGDVMPAMDMPEMDAQVMDAQVMDVGHEHTASANMSSMSNTSHAGHQAAHPAAMALVSADQATNTVVASGNWSDPSVWQDGALPATGARIVIPHGMTLTVDSVMSEEFKTIGIMGTLRFATDVNTELRVDTIVSSPHGRFEMGTASNPVAADVTAKVVFTDDGAIDTTWDPSQLSRGALLHGPVVIHGADATHRVALAQHPTAGATSIQLSGIPIGWKVGDEIVITGTQGSTSDEVRTIQSIDGANVRLNQALSLDHTAPTSDLNVYVANTTRNVQFSSENTAVARRGHIMFMHTNDVNIYNAEFTNLGRTDKTRPLDDVIFDFDGGAVGNETSAPVVFTTTEGAKTNIRGRYAVHFHRGGTDPNSTPAVINGSVVNGSPGWGFVNHSANVNMIDNVAYGVQGAAFYTEAGDEIGEMVGNIAIRTVSPTFTLDDAGAIDPDLRADVQDFGVDGDGFWLSGHMVSMRNNVSAGASGHGMIIWSDGLVEADVARGRASVKVNDVANGHLITGRDTIPTWWAPLAEISNNESYGATIGFRSRYVHSAGYLGEIGSAFHTPPDQAYIDTLQPTIDGLTVWGSRDGVLMNYNERMSLKNARLVGIGAPYQQNGGTADIGVGLDLYNEVSRGPGVIENVSIEGFNMGLLAPRQDNWRITNVELSNTTDMLITEPRQAARVLDMNNVTFGSLDGTAVADQAAQRRNIVMSTDFDADAHQPFFFLLSDRITLDGQQIYFDEQAANFIPLQQQIEHEGARVPIEMIGQTNKQLMDRYGTSFGGAIIPADAMAVAYVFSGVVGSPSEPAATYPPLYHVASEGAGGVLIDPGTLTNFSGPVSVPGEGGDDGTDGDPSEDDEDISDNADQDADEDLEGEDDADEVDDDADNDDSSGNGGVEEHEDEEHEDEEDTEGSTDHEEPGEEEELGEGEESGESDEDSGHEEEDEGNNDLDDEHEGGDAADVDNDDELDDESDDESDNGDSESLEESDEDEDEVDSEFDDGAAADFDDSSSQQAFDLDQSLGLSMDSSYYENWGGMEEKWLRAANGDWYFIRPSGDLFLWDGNNDLGTSKLVASLHKSCYDDPTLLHDAQDPRVMSRNDDSSRSAQDDAIQQVAFNLDQDLGLRMDGSYYENWGGLGEKWMRAADRGWYFITPDGGLYQWGGGNDLSASELVATLDSSWFDDPSLLHDAQDPNAVTDGDVQSSSLANAISGLGSLGLYSNGSYYENWGGMNEKWMLSSDGSWYFITESGELYLWDGASDLSTSSLVASLDSSCYSDPTCLFDTANV